jgi:F-type H+-transporting ATPase subunit gamma
MPSLKDIRSRISSVKNTQQITRAMKMVSAAKLRRAQDQIVNMRPYAQKLLSVISDIAVTSRVQHQLLQQKSNPKQILLVVITSDRGLCGGFNNNVNRFVQKFLETDAGQFEKVDVLFIGKKGADYFRRRGVNPLDVQLNLARDISYDLAAGLAQRCLEEFKSGGYDEVRIAYNEFKSAISQRLTVETLLPVDTKKSNFGLEKTKFSEDLLFEPSAEEMIEDLLRQHFSIQVFRCLSESVAAEHAARMTSMENATKNAKEMIEKLTLTYNKLRQASITKELIEICSGAEAVNAN